MLFFLSVPDCLFLPEKTNLFRQSKELNTTHLLSPEAWIPPPVSRVQYLSCMVLKYHLLVLASNSSWNVSWSEISSWFAVTSTPEEENKRWNLKNKIYCYSINRSAQDWFFIKNERFEKKKKIKSYIEVKLKHNGNPFKTIFVYIWHSLEITLHATFCCWYVGWSTYWCGSSTFWKK